MGRTVADDRTIRDVRRAVALLEQSSPARLMRLVEETSRTDSLYIGIRLKRIDSGTFEFSCWTPCRGYPALQDLDGALPEVEQITHDFASGRQVSEMWRIRLGAHVRTFQVRYFYVPGGGGETPIASRKPDRLYVKRVP